MIKDLISKIYRMQNSLVKGRKQTTLYTYYSKIKAHQIHRQ